VAVVGIIMLLAAELLVKEITGVLVSLVSPLELEVVELANLALAHPQTEVEMAEQELLLASLVSLLFTLAVVVVATETEPLLLVLALEV
jgi:hypothetical protein